MGCTFDNDSWKIHETRERGGHFIIKGFVNENQAFDYFYDFLVDMSI